MIRLTIDEKGETFSLVQNSTVPLVYLDTCAFMDVATSHAERFGKALLRHGGTLGVSWIGFVELAYVDEPTTNANELLLAHVWPSVVFLETDGSVVAAKENQLLGGSRDVFAPHIHTQFAAEFAKMRRNDSVDPLDPQGFLGMMRSPEMRRSFSASMAHATSEAVEMFNDTRRKFDTDPGVRKRILARPSGTPRQHPTFYAYLEVLKHLVRNNMRITANHVKDSWHTVVPLSYCDYVVLDRTWAHIALETQNRLDKAGLLTHRASVYPVSRLSDFLRDLEGGESSSTAVNRP